MHKVQNVNISVENRSSCFHSRHEAALYEGKFATKRYHFCHDDLKAHFPCVGFVNLQKDGLQGLNLPKVMIQWKMASNSSYLSAIQPVWTHPRKMGQKFGAH